MRPGNLNPLKLFVVTREVTLTNWSREENLIYAASEADALRIAAEQPCMWDDCNLWVEPEQWDVIDQKITVTKNPIEAKVEIDDDELPEVV